MRSTRGPEPAAEQPHGPRQPGAEQHVIAGGQAEQVAIMNTAAFGDPDWLREYQALTAGAGLAELGERTQIELSGPDRATFLHNLCTNEVRRLAVGSGCEAFMTTVQGKTLGHVFIFACPTSLVIDTVGGAVSTEKARVADP